MKVRVERIRPGRRTAEVEYVEANTPRRRGPNRGEAPTAFWDQSSISDEQGRQRLRLPWQIHNDRS